MLPCSWSVLLKAFQHRHILQNTVFNASCQWRMVFFLSRERSTTCNGKCLSQYCQLWQVPLDPNFKLALIPLLPFLSQPSLLTWKCHLPIFAVDPRSIMPPLIDSYRPYHSYRPRRTWSPGTTSYHGRATSPRRISPPCSKRYVNVLQSHDGVGWSFSMLAPTPSPSPRAFSSNGNGILHERALDKKLSKRSAWTKRVYVFTLSVIRFVNKLTVNIGLYSDRTWLPTPRPPLF